jgi:AcrR family transcriptional regulator
MARAPLVKPPLQTRSRRTLERIVSAALAILEDDGPGALTVQAVVERAGSSVGSFYARFSGKDDLLTYLGERMWREASERWDHAVQTRDWGQLHLRALAEGSVGLLWEAARSRASTLQALDRMPGGMDDAYQTFRDHLLEGIAGLFLNRSDEIRHAEPEVAVHIGLRAVLGIVEHDTGPVRDRGRVTEEASTLLLCYLAPEAAYPHAPDGQVDFFDIWG